MNYLEAFKKRTDLIDKFREDNAYLAWVMALYLQRNDVFELANDGLTDGKNDKKIDFIDLDTGLGIITIAQGYYAESNKEEAPSNKASDLNTAAAWLVSGDLDTVPENLKNLIKNCRKAIENDDINKIELLYIHNLPESDNCKRELNTVAKHFGYLLESKGIDVSSKEFGSATIETMFMEYQSQILVKDEIILEEKPLFIESTPDWIAYNFSVSGKWLYDIYGKYGEDLFSANYRGFLGIGKRKKINNAIKQSAETESDNFWVYNNGITVLTLDVDDKDTKTTKINGISIINGAQTTGSIGSIEKIEKLDNVKVFCRVVKCLNPSIIPKIVKANNTQNVITSWDRYSNSSEQSSIKNKFLMYNKDYSLKRGINSSNSDLSIYTVAQPTLAFEGNYAEANRGKNNIFLSVYLYESIFNKETKARHLLLTYTLSKAIDSVKYEVKFSEKNEYTNIELKQIDFFRNLKFKMFAITLIANCLEHIVDKRVDLKKISFNKEASQQDIDFLTGKWKDIVRVILKMLATLVGNDDIGSFIDNKNKFDELSKNMETQLSMFSAAYSPTMFKEFSDMLWEG